MAAADASIRSDRTAFEQPSQRRKFHLAPPLIRILDVDPAAKNRPCRDRPAALPRSPRARARRPRPTAPGRHRTHPRAARPGSRRRVPQAETPLRPNAPGQVVPVEAQDVKHEENDVNRTVAAQHAVAEQRPKSQAGTPRWFRATSSPSNTSPRGSSSSSGTRAVISQLQRLRTSSPHSVETIARKPCSLSSNTQPDPPGIEAGRRCRREDLNRNGTYGPSPSTGCPTASVAQRHGGPGTQTGGSTGRW